MEKIFNAIELAGKTQVPVMFISNPGEGKTTAVELWADANGYHCEVLIGSQYSQDEILGYQVNNKGQLDVLEPEWFRRITKAGKPSVLFLDEMSAAHPSVQGALLNLCSSREIRGGKKLPEDCIVVAAANFKENLPDFCDLLTPQINRFMIINLSTDNNTALDTYLSFEKPTYPKDRPLYKDVAFNKLTKVQEMVYQDSLRTKMGYLFDKYASKTASKGYIDMKSPSPAYLYGALEGKVLNVITGRSIHYFSRVLKACIEFGYEKQFALCCAEGLIGYGTGNWSSDDEEKVSQLKKFKTAISEIINHVYNSIDNFKVVDNDTTKNVESDDLSTLLFEDLNKGGKGNEQSIIVEKIEDLKNRVLENDLTEPKNSGLKSDFMGTYPTMRVWLNNTTRKKSDALYKIIHTFVERFDIYFESMMLCEKISK